MKKLSILAAFALSAALILSGCNPNAEDETADGTGTTTETTATDTGSTTTTTTTTGGSTDSGSSGSTETGSASGSTTETTVKPTVATVSSISLEDNITNGNNYQAIVTWLDASNKYVASVGDKLHFVIEGTSDQAVSEYKAFLVDNSEAAGWWNLVSGYVNTGATVAAGAAVTIEFDIDITAASSSEKPEACKLGLYCDADGNSVSNLTVTKFEVTLK